MGLRSLPTQRLQAGTGDTMTRRPRRNHCPAFKWKVGLAAIEASRRLLNYPTALIAAERKYSSRSAGQNYQTNLG